MSNACCGTDPALQAAVHRELCKECSGDYDACMAVIAPCSSGCCWSFTRAVTLRDVGQGWTIGRRISHCDVTIYHYFTVYMADPRLADFKSKVSAAAAADTRVRKRTAGRDVASGCCSSGKVPPHPPHRRASGRTPRYVHCIMCQCEQPTPRLLLTRVLQLSQRGTRVPPLAWLPASRFRHAVFFKSSTRDNKRGSTRPLHCWLPYRRISARAPMYLQHRHMLEF